jgi:hypothetical protein
MAKKTLEEGFDAFMKKLSPLTAEHQHAIRHKKFG